MGLLQLGIFEVVNKTFGNIRCVKVQGAFKPFIEHTPKKHTKQNRAQVRRKCSQHQQVSPEDGVIGQLTEALAHTRCTTQVLLQQVREDL